MNLKSAAFLGAVALVAFAGTLAGHLVGSRIVVHRQSAAQAGIPLEFELQPYAGGERLQPVPDLSAELKSLAQDEADASQSAELASAIDREMPDATPDEKQAWQEELQNLSFATAREILNLRNRLVGSEAVSEKPGTVPSRDDVTVPSPTR